MSKQIPLRTLEWFYKQVGKKVSRRTIYLDIDFIIYDRAIARRFFYHQHKYGYRYEEVKGGKKVKQEGEGRTKTIQAPNQKDKKNKEIRKLEKESIEKRCSELSKDTEGSSSSSYNRNFNIAEGVRSNVSKGGN